MSYLYIFLQSNILEFPVYLYFLNTLKTRQNFLQGAYTTTLINSVTHPIVFFVIMALPLTYLQNILLAELFAVVAEALILIRFLRAPVLGSFVASLLANLISWQLAPMLTFSFFAP